MACNDGNACTQTDTCQARTCTGSNPVVCVPQDLCHAAGTCNSTTGLCSNPAKANNTPCSNGDACTAGEACQAGVCTGGHAMFCASGSECVNGACFITGSGAGCPNCDGSSCARCAGSVDGTGSYLCANLTSTACSSNADCPVGEACTTGGGICIVNCCPAGYELVNGACFKITNSFCQGCFPCAGCFGSIMGSGNYLCAKFVNVSGCTSNADCPAGQACWPSSFGNECLAAVC